MKKDVSMFVDYVVALIKGDEAGVQSVKIQRKANAVITAQIAVKKAHTLTLDESLEDASEQLALARANGGELIKDSDDYLLNLMRKDIAVKQCESNLEEHLDSIKFLELQLKEVSK